MLGTPTTDRAPRNVNINLRASDVQRSLIDQAARALGKNRSDFMLEASCREAETVLLERRYFALDDATFEAFTAMLDTPPTSNPRLRRVLAAKPPWDR